MRETSIATDLVAAYVDTNYRVAASPPFVLRIDQHSPALADAYRQSHVASAVFITADNPFSETTSEAQNAANHIELGAQLRELTEYVFDGAGQGAAADWPAESSYLALGLSRAQACAFGIQFRQNAIVIAEADAIPRLVLLR